jgi:hypothetical protein
VSTLVPLDNASIKFNSKCMILSGLSVSRLSNGRVFIGWRDDTGKPRAGGLILEAAELDALNKTAQSLPVPSNPTAYAYVECVRPVSGAAPVPS